MINLVNSKKGFTLIEILVFSAIAVGIITVIASFITNLGNFEGYFNEALSVEQEIRQTLSVIVPEIRSAAQSNIGNYPIEAASENTFVFYSDIDKNGLFDRVRYFLDGNVLRKGVIAPSGNPLIYDPANEVIRDVVNNIVLGPNIFTYYGADFSGAEPALPFPINIPDVRLIETTIRADQAENFDAQAIEMSVRATIRNLRSN